MEEKLERPIPPRGRVFDDGMSLFYANKVLRLPNEDSGLAHNIVRLENSLMGRGKGKIRRRTALHISNRSNDAWIIRYSMGNGGTVKGLNKDNIALDYDGIKELDIEYKTDCCLTVRKARWWHVTKWFWNYQDLNVRLSFRLGLIGFLLGIISFVDLMSNFFL